VQARRGAAALELAILLPFLGLMFTAALDFARVFHVTQTLQSAAQTGALVASGTACTPPSSGSVTDAATRAACADGTSLTPPLQSGGVTVSFDDTSATVTVDYDFELLTPVLGSSQTVHLRRTVTLRRAPVPGQ
jgi:Flp pilus assembly protein TadG